MVDRQRIKAKVNGEEVEFLCDPRQSLLECLRDVLNLTGTKEGCNDGNCGVCAVLLDGQLVNSCLVLGCEVNGREVTTIEGLADWRGLHPLQQAFLEHNGYQCGYCTPGVIMAAKALLDEKPNPTEEEIRHWLAGNLCRCTGYDKLVRAVMDAAARVRGDVPSFPGRAMHPDDSGTGRSGIMGGYRVIGTRPVRTDGADKVTGKAVFAADVRLPGMLYAKAVRSPYAHARIRSIDTSKAATLPGVKAVIAAEDLWALDGIADARANCRRNVRYARDKILAYDIVRFAGQPVAAVAAVDRFVAAEAAALVAVEYDPLPVVLDVREAMKEDAPLLHNDLFTDSLGKRGDRPSNIARHVQFLKGDPEKGFAKSDIVIEREVRTATVHQGYLEPPAVVADWGEDDTITVYCSTQGLFTSRAEIARVLNHPESRVRLVPMEVGGGFGGKGQVYEEPIAALLSRKARRPVKIAMTRSEVHQVTGPTPGTCIKVKMGVSKDGWIQAVKAELLYEAGAFPGAFIDAGARCMFGHYDIPNGQIDAYDVVVNKPKSAPYRAPCVTQAAFAAETIIDEICEKLKMDPLEFRLKNAAVEGTRELSGLVLPQVGFKETIKAALEHPHYHTPLTGPHRARGVAAGLWFAAGGPSTCSLTLNGDGSVNLATGSVDLQGTRTSIAMQAAEVLGIAVEDIHPAVVDTSSTGFNMPTVGSRTTFATGIAAIEAAKKLLTEMCNRVARLWAVDIETVRFEAGVFTASGDQKLQLTFKEVAARQNATGGPIYAAVAVSPAGSAGTISVHIVDVELDPDTGKTKVLRFTSIQDAGTAVHPDLVEGQMQGGTVQSIGWALNEGYQYDNEGRLLNDTLQDYRLPTALDVPMIDTAIVEVPNPRHPFGVKGVGESTITPGPAALANALYRITGVRMRELPMSPLRILKATGVIE